MVRIIAVFVLLIPGVLAAFGIKLMRDALFAEVFPILFNSGVQFIVGLLLFIGGLAFIGGFVVHRDRRNNLVNRDKRRD